MKGKILWRQAIPGVAIYTAVHFIMQSHGYLKKVYFLLLLQGIQGQTMMPILCILRVITFPISYQWLQV